MRTRRVVTMEPPTKPVVAGETYCLIEWENLDPSRRRRGSELTKTPVTDGQHDPCWLGWLGTSDDITRVARGAWRAVSVAPALSVKGSYEPRWRVSLARVPDPVEGAPAQP